LVRRYGVTGELRYAAFDTEMGWVGILASARGLLGTTLPRSSAEEARTLLGANVGKASWAPQEFTDLMARLRAYFAGGSVAFSDKLDLGGATAFQRKVWAMTRLIPYGETRSYLWLARQIRQPRTARAVGQALARNPLAIIVPCHRVIASDGSLGGFGGGLAMKQRLLRLEAGRPRP